MPIGLIGAGRMAQALVKGVIKAGIVKPTELMASAHVQDVHHLEEMAMLEMVQQRAARVVYEDYRCDHSVTAMMEDPEWDTLLACRDKLGLNLFEWLMFHNGSFTINFKQRHYQASRNGHSMQFSERMGCQTSIVNKDVVRHSDVIVLAVKPQIMKTVLQDISSEISRKHLVISIALGINLSRIEQTLPDKTRVIRVMPNTPSLVLAGASVFCGGSYATPEDNKFAKKLFSCVGICEGVPESYLNAVTALSGSGPAYIYIVIEALADGGVKMGLPRDLSLKLAAQCVLGSAKMVLEEKRHPGSMKDDVASPGGCTIHALHLLEKAGVRALFISAVEEATKIAEKFGVQ